MLPLAKRSQIWTTYSCRQIGHSVIAQNIEVHAGRKSIKHRQCFRRLPHACMLPLPKGSPGSKPRPRWSGCTGSAAFSSTFLQEKMQNFGLFPHPNCRSRRPDAKIWPSGLRFAAKRCDLEVLQKPGHNIGCSGCTHPDLRTRIRPLPAEYRSEIIF